MNLGEKITDLRKRNSLSQEELAEKLDVSRQSVSKWETDRSFPDIEKIIQLSELFSVSTDCLLKDDGKAFVSSGDDLHEQEESKTALTLEEAIGFIEAKAKTSKIIAFATFLCIISPIPLITLPAVSESGIVKITENASAGIGLCFLSVLIAVAVCLFIFCGSKTKRYGYICENEFYTDTSVTDYVKDLRNKYTGKFTAFNIVGVMLCILSVVPIFACLCFESKDFVYVLMVGLLLLFVAIGVPFFVVSGIMDETFQRLLHEGEYGKKDKSHFEEIYWLIITAVFLAYSFITNDWARSWIIWPVAGVLFAAISAVYKIYSQRKK